MLCQFWKPFFKVNSTEIDDVSVSHSRVMGQTRFSDNQPDRMTSDSENKACCQVQGGHLNKGNTHARERRVVLGTCPWVKHEESGSQPWQFIYHLSVFQAAQLDKRSVKLFTYLKKRPPFRARTISASPQSIKSV